MRRIIISVCLVFSVLFSVFSASPSEMNGIHEPEIPMRMKISVNGHNLTATLSDNSSSAELYKLLLQGDITVNADDYGNFEKVGSLPVTLPRNDKEITASAGDIILYRGDSICFYYGTNNWNFTKLGRIDGSDELNLKEIYSRGDAVFRLSAIREGGYRQITQEEASELMEGENGFILLDVRTRAEYDSGHIPGAICIPNEDIGTTPPAELPDLNQMILVYCRSGNRSKQASQKLADMGYTDVREFGGIITWKGKITI